MKKNMKKLCTVQIHSFVGLITNSSTELFCVVESDAKKAVEAIVEEIKQVCPNDFEWRVYEHEDDEGNKIANKFEIWYNQNYVPCKFIKSFIKEKFNIIENGSY